MKRRLLIAALALATSMGAMADEVAAPANPAVSEKTYAAVSLISDALEIVVARGETGSNLPTKVNRIALPTPDFDTVALLAIKDAFEKKGTEKPVVLMRSSEKMYSEQKDLLSGTKFKGVAGLDAALSASKITHLVVITKYRDKAILKLSNMSVGSGRLQGLGFYLDYQFKIENTNDYEKGTGFLAPYAYFKVSLVDVATSTVTKEVNVTAGRVMAASTKTAGSSDPWASLSDAEKDKLLRDMVQNEVSKAVSSFL